MRKIITYSTAKDFLEKAETVLEKAEEFNNLILGLSYGLVENPKRYGTDPIFAVTENDGAIELVALMTSPCKIVVYSPSNQDIEGSYQLVLDKVKSLGLTIPGVIGPRETANGFNNTWIEQNRGSSTLSMRMRIYTLTEVASFKKPEGKFRLAEEGDIPVLKRWIDEFYSNVFENTAHVIKDDAVELVRNSEIFVWDNNGIVTMADRRRPTKHGYVIGQVYTPEEERNKGYATACVGSLCQYILDSGKRFCSLFADLNNPISNGIYQRIGFRELGDFYDYTFEDVQG